MHRVGRASLPPQAHPSPFSHPISCLVQLHLPLPGTSKALRSSCLAPSWVPLFQHLIQLYILLSYEVLFVCNEVFSISVIIVGPSREENLSSTSTKHQGMVKSVQVEQSRLGYQLLILSHHKLVMLESLPPRTHTEPPEEMPVTAVQSMVIRFYLLCRLLWPKLCLSSCSCCLLSLSQSSQYHNKQQQQTKRRGL